MNGSQESMEPQRSRDLLSHRVKSALLHGLLSGLAVGLILFLADLYIGLLFLKISPRAYFGNFTAFVISSACVGICANFLFALGSRFAADKTTYYRTTLISILLLVQFVYLNTKLTGALYSLTLRSVVLNAMLLSGIIGFTVITYRNKQLKSILSSIVGLATFSLLIFHFTAQFNFFFMEYPLLPDKKTLILSTAIFIILIPFMASLVVIGLKLLLGRFKFSKRAQPIGAFLFSLVVVAIIPPALNHPYWGHYQEMNYHPTDSQLANLEATPNLIWIVLDTARKDRFSCYGHNRNTTPNIDALARDGVLFNNYISTSPWTAPSHASMFTGMYPSKNGCHNSANGKSLQPLAYENVTIAETLNDIGMNTAAIFSNYSMTKNRQMQQGFNFYYCQTSGIMRLFWGLVAENSGAFFPIYKSGLLRLNYYQLGSEINRIAFHWLTKNSENPMFLFINYMEAHEGSDFIPHPYGSRYDFSWNKWNRIWRKEVDFEAITRKKQDISPEQLQIQYDWVDCKLSYLDAQIGNLLDRLKEMGLYDNAMIVLTSDHGDLYGEHHSFKHTTDLYNELISVPLIIKYPESMNKKGVVQDYIQTVDIMPEVLTVMDVAIPEGVQGQPFSDADHSIISELYDCDYHMMNKLNRDRYSRDLRSIIERQGGIKYIQSTKENDSELFDIITDPREQDNLISVLPGEANQLDRQLNNWLLSFEPVSTDTVESSDLDDDLKKKLKSLGYIR